MKFTLFLILGLAVGAFSRANETQLPHVTVFGTAVTEVKPDLLRWHLTISNTGADISAVAKTHSEIAALLLRTLAEQGIRSEDMQTSAMQLAEHREYRANTWVKDGYVASTAVSFKMKDLPHYSETWLRLAQVGGVSIDYVSWDLTNRIAVQNSTRTEALKNAKAKAEQMAAALGVHIAEPLSIEEIDVETPWGGQPRMANSVSRAPSDGADSDDSIAPGTIPIRIRVQVSFRVAGP